MSITRRQNTFRLVVGFFVMCGFPAFDRMAFPRRHKEPESGDTVGDAEKSSNPK